MRSASAARRKCFGFSVEGTVQGGAGALEACLVVPEEQHLVEAARFVLVRKADRCVPAHLGLDDGDHAGS